MFQTNESVCQLGSEKTNGILGVKRPIKKSYYLPMRIVENGGVISGEYGSGGSRVLISLIGQFKKRSGQVIFLCRNGAQLDEIKGTLPEVSLEVGSLGGGTSLDMAKEKPLALFIDEQADLNDLADLIKEGLRGPYPKKTTIFIYDIPTSQVLNLSGALESEILSGDICLIASFAQSYSGLYKLEPLTDLLFEQNGGFCVVMKELGVSQACIPWFADQRLLSSEASPIDNAGKGIVYSAQDRVGVEVSFT